MNDEIKKLEEAINHCKDIENSKVCNGCKQDHKQLRKWLEELLAYKLNEC